MGGGGARAQCMAANKKTPRMASAAIPMPHDRSRRVAAGRVVRRAAAPEPTAARRCARRSSRRCCAHRPASCRSAARCPGRAASRDALRAAAMPRPTSRSPWKRWRARRGASVPRRRCAVLDRPAAGARRAVRAARFAATTADGRHVLAVAAHRDAALAAGGAGLARVELVGRALLVRGAPALAGDLALLAPIHRREAAIAAAAARGARIRRVVGPDVLAVRSTRRASALVRDFALPLPVGAEAALFVVRSDRHYCSSWKCWAPARSDAPAPLSGPAPPLRPSRASPLFSCANCGPMCLQSAIRVPPGLVFPTERRRRIVRLLPRAASPSAEATLPSG